MLEDYWDRVNKALVDETLWTDDFGWGGTACLSVAEYVMLKRPSSPPPSWTAWRDQGIQCFGNMKENGTVRRTASLSNMEFPTALPTASLLIMRRTLSPMQILWRCPCIYTTFSRSIRILRILRQ